MSLALVSQPLLFECFRLLALDNVQVDDLLVGEADRPQFAD